MGLVETVRALLEPVPAIRLAALFGSSAQPGAAGADLDLAVGLHPGTDMPAELEALLERATGLPVDLVRIDTAPPLLRFEIARGGILLLEREAHAWADFRARAALDWWDWAPTASLIQRTVLARLRQEASRGPS